MEKSRAIASAKTLQQQMAILLEDRGYGFAKETELVYDSYDEESDFEEESPPVFDLYEDEDEFEDGSVAVFDVYEEEDSPPVFDVYEEEDSPHVFDVYEDEDDDSDVEPPRREEHKLEKDDNDVGVAMNSMELLSDSPLSETSDNPKSSLAVRCFAVEPSVHEHICQATTIHIKHHLKSRWPPPQDIYCGNDFNIVLSDIILDQKKDHIRNLIVSLLVNSPTRIQYQMSEAFVEIGEQNFTKSCPNSLHELVVTRNWLTQLYGYASVNGVLAADSSFFKNFLYQFQNNDFLIDLTYYLDDFLMLLLEVFKGTASLIDQVMNLGSVVIRKPCIESQHLCFRIFESLNLLEMLEFLKSHMNGWMAEFNEYQNVTYADLEDAGTDGFGLALTDELRAAVCENTRLYMEKEDLIQTSFNRFVQKLGYETKKLQELEKVARLNILQAMSELEQTKTRLKTYEIRLIKARKLKNAARAKEVVSFSEIKAIIKFKKGLLEPEIEISVKFSLLEYIGRLQIIPFDPGGLD